MDPDTEFQVFIQITIHQNILKKAELSPEGTLDPAKLALRFYPIFYIAAVTADVANNRDFFHQRKGWGINIVAACMAVLIVGDTDDIL